MSFGALDKETELNWRTSQQARAVRSDRGRPLINRVANREHRSSRRCCGASSSRTSLVAACALLAGHQKQRSLQRMLRRAHACAEFSTGQDSLRHGSISHPDRVARGCWRSARSRQTQPSTGTQQPADRRPSAQSQQLTGEHGRQSLEGRSRGCSADLFLCGEADRQRLQARDVSIHGHHHRVVAVWTVTQLRNKNEQRHLEL